MKIILERIEIQTRADKELVDITPEVDGVIGSSGVVDGIVLVVNTHTSAGIVVTEGLPCLEQDVLNNLEALAPDQGDYYHNRYLDIDGRLGFNAGAHLKGVLSGYSAIFPLEGGRMVRGGRQRIYFAEYDGPLARTVLIQVIGE